MKISKSIWLLVLVAFCACDPTPNNPTPDTGINAYYDSVFTIVDIQWHEQYYPLLERQVYSIDLLTDGLCFDSSYHITGSGLNLYFSDIFLPLDERELIDGTYHMDTTAAAYTFLPYMYFEGEITGCYMLDIHEDAIRRIIGFTAGAFELSSTGDNIQLNISLYTADSTRYRACYSGPAMYR